MENQRLKDENGALIRVITKLSKWGRRRRRGMDTRSLYLHSSYLLSVLCSERMYVHSFPVILETWLPRLLWNLPVTVLDLHIRRQEIHSIKIHIVYSLKYFYIRKWPCAFIHCVSMNRLSRIRPFINPFNHIKNISACINGQNIAGSPTEVLPWKLQYFVIHMQTLKLGLQATTVDDGWDVTTVISDLWALPWSMMMSQWFLPCNQTNNKSTTVKCIKGGCRVKKMPLNMSHHWQHETKPDLQYESINPWWAERSNDKWKKESHLKVHLLVVLELSAILK